MALKISDKGASVVKCPFCAAKSIDVEVYQKGELNRCLRCMRDMYCPTSLSPLEKIARRQLDKVEEVSAE